MTWGAHVVGQEILETRSKFIELAVSQFPCSTAQFLFLFLFTPLSSHLLRVSPNQSRYKLIDVFEEALAEWPSSVKLACPVFGSWGAPDRSPGGATRACASGESTPTSIFIYFYCLNSNLEFKVDKCTLALRGLFTRLSLNSIHT